MLLFEKMRFWAKLRSRKKNSSSSVFFCLRDWSLAWNRKNLVPSFSIFFILILESAPNGGWWLKFRSSSPWRRAPKLYIEMSLRTFSPLFLSEMRIESVKYTWWKNLLTSWVLFFWKEDENRRPVFGSKKTFLWTNLLLTLLPTLQSEKRTFTLPWQTFFIFRFVGISSNLIYCPDGLASVR